MCKIWIFDLVNMVSNDEWLAPMPSIIFHKLTMSRGSQLRLCWKSLWVFLLCYSTIPIPLPEASHSMLKGWLKFGIVRIGVVVIALLSSCSDCPFERLVVVCFLLTTKISFFEQIESKALLSSYSCKWTILVAYEAKKSP